MRRGRKKTQFATKIDPLGPEAGSPWCRRRRSTPRLSSALSGTATRFDERIQDALVLAWDDARARPKVGSRLLARRNAEVSAFDKRARSSEALARADGA
jgi:hypothetical protein